ncbi:hypothetical protein LCGC14_2283580 [marine sediment metagenome]|uniref:Uncharacterized protein n=1 Tax=marine sediment metagenome TaxID=412755 RepID=A0A0F9F5U4_9ZZZZ
MTESETEYGLTKSAMLAYSYGGRMVAHIVAAEQAYDGEQPTAQCGVSLHSLIMVEGKYEICANCRPL